MHKYIFEFLRVKANSVKIHKCNGKPERGTTQGSFPNMITFLKTQPTFVPQYGNHNLPNFYFIHYKEIRQSR